MFIDMFLGSAVSVSKQVGTRSMFIDMFLGSAVCLWRYESDRCSTTCF